jgi:tRNA(fMet)-specific endonuclease VapC
MMRCLFDTDMLTLYEEGHPEVCRNVAAHHPDDLGTTIISVEEQLFGWFTMLRRAKDRKASARIYQRMTDTVTFLARMQISSFTEPAIARYEALQAMKLNIGGKDLRIAAIVLEEGAILVTRNARDFRRVPGLVIEDWSL